ncbi:hypothetical protein GCM10023185_40250 [Hymenobacter saemangeumensis]|uniref:DUF3857 domain-containing protein n=1 Tax=Hymenobacter saemangeumensis TaxID=1084522 RepID=A0ABP8IRK0_9BACT
MKPSLLSRFIPGALLGSALLLSQPLYAQKIIDTKTLFTFHKSPKAELASRYKTYKVEYDFGKRPLTPEQAPLLKGLERTEGSADLLLKVKVRSFYIAKRNLLQAGSKEAPTFHYTITYRANCGYELIDLKNNTLLASHRSYGDYEDTPDFKSVGALNDYVDNTYLPKKGDYLLRGVLRRIDYDLNPHDFPIEVVVNTVEGGIPAYGEISKNVAVLSAMLTQPRPDKQQLAPVIATWEKYLLSANWNDKKSEINKPVANALIENLCVAYLLTED